MNSVLIILICGTYFSRIILYKELYINLFYFETKEMGFSDLTAQECSDASQKTQLKKLQRHQKWEEQRRANSWYNRRLLGRVLMLIKRKTNEGKHKLVRPYYCTPAFVVKKLREKGFNVKEKTLYAHEFIIKW
jgi:hypothetical protein